MVSLSDLQLGPLKFRNVVQSAGWAGLYHAATLDHRVTDGALRLYLVLLMHAQQADSCYPGRERLAALMGVTEKTITRRMSNLVKAGYVTRERQMGTSSITWIEDLTRNAQVVAVARLEMSRRAVSRALKQDGLELTWAEREALAETLAARLASGDKNVPLDSGDKNGSTVGSKMGPPPGHKRTRKEQQGGKQQEEGLGQNEDALLFWGEGGEPPQDGAAPAAPMVLVPGDQGLAEGWLALAQQTQAAQAARNWAWVQDDGSPEPWAPAATAFCALVGRTPGGLDNAEREAWPRELERWATARDQAATPQETAQAIQAITQSEHSWRSFASPFETGFHSILNTMLDRLRTGAPINAKGRKNGRATQAAPAEQAQALEHAFQ